MRNIGDVKRRYAPVIVIMLWNILQLASFNSIVLDVECGAKAAADRRGKRWRRDQAILIVDDNELVRESLAADLEAEGYTIYQAKNGKDVSKIINEHHLSVLITDVLMPECDGLEILRNLKGHEERPKIIVISGGGIIDRGTCLRLADAFGADAVLAKPFRRDELLCMIEDLISA